ncbi:FRG domain-containing protein, partial [Bathymodiolus thermophilus thioautotrophic gill symbiont]|uniref:FRG domain-containing protein n=1 Tax=Bathymodiolus thermophilus thioautotrophic gill symbiont TaxID=2360 RepID=UPI000A67ACED
KYLRKLKKVQENEIDCIYRGLSDKSYPVCSTYYRRFNLGKNPKVWKKPSAKEFQAYHDKLLLDAKSYHYHKNKELSSIELLAELQHFGAATGLIDFSKNFLVALWFASNSNPGKDGKISLLNEGDCVDYVENKNLYQNTLDAFCLVDLNFKSNNRIFAQNGVFIFTNRVFYKDLDLHEIIISKKDKEQIIIELKTFYNITESTLFQDIYGFAEVNNAQHSIGNNADDFSRQAKHYIGIGGLKNLTKAIDLYNLALESDIKTYGESHSDVAVTRSNLASALGARDQPGDLTKAIELYNLALESDIKTYDESHSEVAVTRSNLANALEARNQPEDLTKAIELYNLALESDIRVYGESHSEVATARNNLAGALETRNQPGDLIKAIDLYNLTLESDIKTYDESHSDVATARNNLAGALEARSQPGDLSKAIELYNLALEIDIQTYGESYPKVVTTRNNLAGTLEARNQPGDLSKAIELYNLALEIDIQTYSESHSKVAIRRNNLASALEARNQSGDLIGVIELYGLALETMQQMLGVDHPNTKVIADNLKQAKARQHSQDKNKP